MTEKNRIFFFEHPLRMLFISVPIENCPYFNVLRQIAQLTMFNRQNNIKNMIMTL